MSGRGRRRMVDNRAGFQQKVNENEIHPQILKQARQSGTLNVSNRGLTEVPTSVYRINLDLPEEAREVKLDNSDQRWWEQEELTKLILASNCIVKLSDDIKLLPALTVLDAHDNALESLPDGLAELTNITKLLLSHNKLTKIPTCVFHLTNIRALLIANNKLQEISDDICKLYVLEELDLSNNELKSLPSSIGFLSKVMKFNISNNKLDRLPEQIGGMNALRVLDVTHNQLTSIPESVGTLSHLSLLHLRHNKLLIIPHLKQCHELKELHVGNNALRQLSVENIKCLNSLSILDVRDNKIETIPDEVVLLHSLERLDITNNGISTLPNEMGKMAKLKHIVLDGNPMKGIRRDIVMRGTNELKKYLASRIIETDDKNSEPSVVQGITGQSGVIGASSGSIDPFTVKNTKTLDYSKKKAPVIPGEIWNVLESVDVITKVDFNSNTLTSFPQKLSLTAENLQELELGFNKIPSIPSEIRIFKKLICLDMRNNVLSELPREISELVHLRDIIISYNRFKVLPSVLYGLPKLESILACDNQIGSIDPAGLLSCSKLGVLDLRNNDLMQVPPELGRCEQLRSLQLEGNPFRVPRPMILTKGTPFLLQYLKDRIPT